MVRADEALAEDDSTLDAAPPEQRAFADAARSLRNERILLLFCGLIGIVPRQAFGPGDFRNTGEQP